MNAVLAKFLANKVLVAVTAVSVTAIGATAVAYTYKNNDPKTEETNKVANNEPTPTSTVEPTFTPTPTIEMLPTSTPVPTITATSIPKSTSTPVPTKKPTATPAPTAVPSLYNTYTSKAFGISFNYPKGYTVSESNGDCVKNIVISGATKITINFKFTPANTCADGSGSYCNNYKSTTTSIKLSNGSTVDKINGSCSDPESYSVTYHGNFSGVSGTYPVNFITSTASSSTESRSDIVVQTIKKM
jgi:hypothetical protein